MGKAVYRTFLVIFILTHFTSLASAGEYYLTLYIVTEVGEITDQFRAECKDFESLAQKNLEQQGLSEVINVKSVVSWSYSLSFCDSEFPYDCEETDFRHCSLNFASKDKKYSFESHKTKTLKLNRQDPSVVCEADLKRIQSQPGTLFSIIKKSGFWGNKCRVHSVSVSTT